MRTLTLTEHEVTKRQPLTPSERDRLREAFPGMAIAPSAGAGELYDIRPGSEVGALKLETLAVEVRPKLPFERLMFLVSYAADPSRWREGAFDFEESGGLLEAIVPAFVGELRRTLGRGMLRGYRHVDESSAAVRGRIRVDDQIRTWFGLAPPIEVSFDDYTTDIDENRILRAALHRLGGLRFRSKEARATLRAAELMFEGVAIVEYGPLGLPEIRFDRLNEHYRPAVRVARLILSDLSFELGHGPVRGTGFVLDMNTVFEDFVATALREALKVTEEEFPQGMSRGLSLDVEGRIRLRPDLSWWKGRGCVFVGDVKYKRALGSPPNPDLYQLLAYTVATGLPGGLLIYGEGPGEDVYVDARTGRELMVCGLDPALPPEELLGQIDFIATRIRTLASRASARTRAA